METSPGVDGEGDGLHNFLWRATITVREQDYPSRWVMSGDRPPICSVVASGSALPSLGVCPPVVEEKDLA